MRTWRTAGLAIALTAYSVFLFWNLPYSLGGPDTSGYMNEARMIAHGRTTLNIDLVRTMRLDDSWLEFFTPSGFAPSPGGRMHPTYPPGLPVHLAIAGLLGGWQRAPFLINPLAAVGSLALLFLIARTLGLTLPFAAAAPITLAFVPALLWHAVQPASDVFAMFWALAVMLGCFKASERPFWSYCAGLAFAIGVSVRPTSLLLALACAFAMRFRPKHLVRFAIGAIPPAVALMWWNAIQYGSSLRTGYGNVLGNLSWDGVVFAGPQYVHFLVAMLSPVVFPGGLLLLFDRRADSWTRWALISWFVPFFAFYCFYGFFDGWWCMRFLLPAIPALILAALIVVRDLRLATLRFQNLAVSSVAAALVVLMCVTPFRSSASLGVFQIMRHLEEGYPKYVQWAEGYLPKRSIVLASVLGGAFLYYANRDIARLDGLDDDHFQQLRAYAGNAGLPWYAVVGDFEIDQPTLEKRFRGKWTMIARLDTVAIYRLDS
jgi:hypothetical protein